jgi:hypothetical protein
MKTKFGVALLVLVGCMQHDITNSASNQTPSTTDPSPPSFVDAGIDASNGVDGSTPPVPDSGETDVGCGGPNAPKCGGGRNCLVDSDCTVSCNYDHVCVMAPSCKVHFGGDTCGSGEVGSAGVTHESCCQSLPVAGFTDAAHPGKQVYLDKYEITAGRIRAFVTAITNQMGGKPDVKGWLVSNQPAYWNNSWSTFLPSDVEGGQITINRLLLGDPRHDGQTQEQAGPGVILPPPTDQAANLGMNHQFGAQVYTDLHGNNCGVFAGSFGFPTYYYPPSVLTKNNEVPRENAIGYNSETIPAQEYLDTKSMNCITNAMLAAFCVWDGGQLATAEVMNAVTESPARSQDISGCGIQYDNHGELLGNILTNTVQSGGKCPAVNTINATFDAGDNLPVPGSFLNNHVYHYPDLGNSTSDKTWTIAAPGRVTADNVGGWMDLAGNLNEAVLDSKTGLFGLMFRGIGYGSSRSDLNATQMPGETILRLQRPEVKSALSGGRCMRFK